MDQMPPAFSILSAHVHHPFPILYSRTKEIS
jgi:hypothetical protein